MKKIVLSLLGILLITGSAFARVENYKTIEPAQYTCPEADKRVCIINKYKTDEIHFSVDCLEDETSKTSKYAPMIKRGECKVEPDPGQYYICEYSDTKCFVTKYASQDKVSCIKKKDSETSKEQQKAIANRVLQDVKANNCRPMYPD